jgi:hypothetical protein
MWFWRPGSSQALMLTSWFLSWKWLLLSSTDKDRLGRIPYPWIDLAEKARPVKYMLITTVITLHWSPFVIYSVTKSLMSYWCKSQTWENTTEKNTINSHAQDTTALRLSAFPTRIHLLLVINIWQSDFQLLHHCQSESYCHESMAVRLCTLHPRERRQSPLSLQTDKQADLNYIMK